MIQVYTDGSCLNNPGPGGWGGIILDNIEIHISGGEHNTTNNIMELRAVIEVLKFYTHENVFEINTDSQYVIKCATGVYKRHKNKDMWKEYDEVSKNKKIVYVWVKGHNGNKYNEKVDRIANEEAKKIKKSCV
jgi:ribonuclease HI